MFHSRILAFERKRPQCRRWFDSTRLGAVRKGGLAEFGFVPRQSGGSNHSGKDHKPGMPSRQKAFLFRSLGKLGRNIPGCE
jgi:hypothetical protein